MLPRRPVLRRRALLGGLAAAAVASTAVERGTAGAATGASAVAPSGSAAGSSAGALRRPNFLIVLVDDLGWGEVGVNGQRYIQTPVLDRLARRGVNFTDAYATPTCAPTRSALFTGLHGGHGPVKRNQDAIDGLGARDITLAKVLRRKGYRTGHIGKWGLGPDDPTHHSFPTRQGIDHFFGYVSQTKAHDYWPTALWRNDAQVTYPENAVADITFAGDLMTQEALGFLDDVGSDPFFLTVGYTTPHAPNEFPSDEPYSSQTWPEGERNHAAQITWTDAQVGILVDRLRERGLLDETVVLFTSDNGPHAEGLRYSHVGSTLEHDPEFFNSNGPFRGIKRQVYEGGVRVPMLALVPGARAGRVVRQPVALWDVLPTFTELAGVPTPRNRDGVSFASLLTGRGRRSGRSTLYFTFRDRGNRDEAVRFGRWKAVRPRGGPLQLYDLARDPGETRDLARRRPDLVRRARTLLRAAVA